MNGNNRELVEQGFRRFFRGKDVTARMIRGFASQVAKRFDPDQIYLFGSHAYGQPNDDSDVDVLVVMPTRNQMSQAFKIHSTLLPPFPLDIIVRTPKNMKWRLEEGESFLSEILSKGKLLYEKDHPRVDSKGRKRQSAGGKAGSRQRSIP